MRLVRLHDLIVRERFGALPDRCPHCHSSFEETGSLRLREYVGRSRRAHLEKEFLRLDAGLRPTAWPELSLGFGCAHCGAALVVSEVRHLEAVDLDVLGDHFRVLLGAPPGSTPERALESAAASTPLMEVGPYRPWLEPDSAEPVMKPATRAEPNGVEPAEDSARPTLRSSVPPASRPRWTWLWWRKSCE